MVLESLIDPWTAKKHPIRLFFIGLLFASISSLFALWIFKSQASLVMVFLTVVISIPLMYATLEEEEGEDIKDDTEKSMLKEHSKAISFLTMMLLGFIVGYSLWFLFLPADTVQTMFDIQLSTIESINSNAIFTTSATGWATSISDIFFSILFNNIKVLIFCLFFAFFFGAGSIFILAWNASVIAAAIGTYVRNGLANYASSLGFTKFAAYFTLFTAGILRYMVHGIFEIAAYFLGALAGGIISVALINQKFGTEGFRKVMFDAFILVIIALALLIFGTFIEVFITPVLF